LTIDLTEKVGISYGGFTAEELTITHPETKKILESAARVVNFPIIGFDFIIGDITKSPYEQKWGIIEANSLPFIDLHHHPAQGTPINIAAYVWNWWS
jgi:D-alanine-D-alanine ligase-like ATP-grasp enzyme